MATRKKQDKMFYLGNFEDDGRDSNIEAHGGKRRPGESIVQFKKRLRDSYLKQIQTGELPSSMPRGYEPGGEFKYENPNSLDYVTSTAKHKKIFDPEIYEYEMSLPKHGETREQREPAARKLAERYEIDLDSLYGPSDYYKQQGLSEFNLTPKTHMEQSINNMNMTKGQYLEHLAAVKNMKDQQNALNARMGGWAIEEAAAGLGPVSQGDARMKMNELATKGIGISSSSARDTGKGDLQGRQGMLGMMDNVIQQDLKRARLAEMERVGGDVLLDRYNMEQGKEKLAWEGLGIQEKINEDLRRADEIKLRKMVELQEEIDAMPTQEPNGVASSGWAKTIEGLINGTIAIGNVATKGAARPLYRGLAGASGQDTSWLR